MHRNVYKHRALIQDSHFLFVTVALPCAAAFWGPCTRPFLLCPTVPSFSNVRRGGHFHYFKMGFGVR